MKIAVFSVSEVEKKFIEKWSKYHNTEVIMTDEPLSINNINFATGCYGVSVQQATPLGDDYFYNKLSNEGVKYIAIRAAGMDMVDMAVCQRLGINVTNVPVYSPRAIAEMGITQALCLLRKLGQYKAQMITGDFRINNSLISSEIYRLTVGVIGLGHIGGETARLYKALGANVIAYNNSRKIEYDPIVEFKNLDYVIANSDILTLHTPLTNSTHHMISKRQLEMMKPNAILINTGRGGLINTDDLVQALQKKQIAGAGLDTIEGEEKFFRRCVSVDLLPDQYRILQEMPNVIITPHVAFYTNTSVENMVNTSLDNILNNL